MSSSDSLDRVVGRAVVDDDGDHFGVVGFSEGVETFEGVFFPIPIDQDGADAVVPAAHH